MKSILGLALIVMLAIAAPGCGYALAGRGSFLPADIRIVGVPLLENRTTMPRLEQIITDKIRTAFINRGGRFTPVPTTSGADAVLSGTIIGLSREPVGVTNQQLASRYVFTVTMRVQFTDARNGQVLWSNESLVFREEYDLRSRNSNLLEGAVLLEQEGPAFDRLATDLARSVVSAILEAF
ncbi:MAG TPA: LPS assembly lipoprotein LptE [Vicinamibacterales bacterium]|nr:LPS assembly lipoprotein LptE [Vicinamibacterales bacterium]